MLENPQRYLYVGPPEIAEHARTATPGTVIQNVDDLRTWIHADSERKRAAQRAGLVVTYIINVKGHLCIADRHDEHVNCAGGQPVLAAGEMTFESEKNTFAVAALSNQSTGYCPRRACWSAVAAALNGLGMARPEAFTRAVVFRRCESCSERNIVRDEHFECALCGATLPQRWNFLEKSRSNL